MYFSFKQNDLKIEDAEFQEKLVAYTEELNALENEQKNTYNRRKAEINAVLAAEKKLKEALQETENLKLKHAEQIKTLNKNEQLFKNQLKAKNKQKIDLEHQLKQLNSTLENLKAAHASEKLKKSKEFAKIETDLKAKCEHLEKECQKAKESEALYTANRDEFQLKLKVDFDFKLDELKKELDRNVSHLVSQNAKSAETANLLLEGEKSENKNKQAIIINLRKEINELKEYNKRFDDQNEFHARKTNELEALLQEERSKIIDKENLISCLKGDIEELNEKINRLTNLNESLMLNIEMEKSCKSTNEKIIDEVKLEKYELEHQFESSKRYAHNLECQINSMQSHISEMEHANSQLIKQLESTHISLAEIKNMFHAELQFRQENEKELNQIRASNLDLNQRVRMLENELTDVKFKADDEKTKYEENVEKLEKTQMQLKVKFEKTLIVENKTLKEKLEQLEKDRNQEKLALNQHLDEINRLKFENKQINSFKDNLKQLVLNSTNEYCKNLINKSDQETTSVDKEKDLLPKNESLTRSFSIDSHGSFQSKSQSSDNLSDANVKFEELDRGTKPLEIKRANFNDSRSNSNNNNNRRYDNDDEYHSGDDQRSATSMRFRRHVHANTNTTTNVQHRISNYKGRNFIPDFNTRRVSRVGQRGGTGFRYSAYNRR